MRTSISGIFAAIAASAVLLASCQKDNPGNDSKATVPQSYLELVKAFRSEKKYIGTSELSSGTKVLFAGDWSVTVPNKEMTVSDCRKTAPASVTLDKSTGTWMVGGKDSRIMKKAGTLEESYPVYSYYTEEKLVIYASNGEIIEFKNTAPAKKYKIPVIRILTDGNAPVSNKDDYIPGTIRVEDPCCYFSDVKVLEKRMAIKGRGNSTWGMPKKPYKIKLDEKSPVLGIAGNKDWVLLANYSDKTLLRNMTAMEISRILGFSWTPSMISVELYLNGSYLGVYTFTEHKEVAKNRVNIDTKNGAFYIELENEDVDLPYWFKTKRYGVTAMVRDPEEPEERQRQELEQWFEDMETAFAKIGHEGDSDWKDYRQYINFQSFVNYYIIEELTRNPDGNFRKSTFLTKEKDKKLEVYHVWDFDLTLGNCNYFENSTDPRGWLMKDCVWFNRLFKSREYINAVRETLNKHYDELLNVTDFIYDQAKKIEGAVDSNFERWPVLGQYVWPNCVWYSSYQEELDFFADYYTGRLEWFKKEMDRM